MSNDAVVDEDDLAFERLLLGAGRAETLPLERTQAALLQFMAGVGALPTVALGVGALRRPASASAWSRAVTAAKWLTLGALAGSAATFAWLQGATTSRASGAPAAALSTQLRGLVSRRAAVVRPAVALLSPESKQRAADPAERATPVAGEPVRARRTAPAGADLAAEVSALDSIRSALAIGAWRDAEQRLSGYRREFARGALRSEAEVLALELLVAQGRTQAAARAAERFVAQHPRDPQVARVRALVE